MLLESLQLAAGPPTPPPYDPGDPFGLHSLLVERWHFDTGAQLAAVIFLIIGILVVGTGIASAIPGVPRLTASFLAEFVRVWTRDARNRAIGLAVLAALFRILHAPLAADLTALLAVLFFFTYVATLSPAPPEPHLGREQLKAELETLQNYRAEFHNWTDEQRHQAVRENPDHFTDPGTLWRLWQDAREQWGKDIDRKCRLASRFFGSNPAEVRALFENHIDEYRKRYELACTLTGDKPHDKT